LRATASISDRFSGDNTARADGAWLVPDGPVFRMVLWLSFS